MTRQTITFDVRFFTPLTSGAALGRDGLDIALHPDPIGGDTLKGAMRHASRDLVPPVMRDRTFGGQGAASPWHWSSLKPAEPWSPKDRYRVAIDPKTGAAQEDQLVRAEYIWPKKASFVCTQIGRDEECDETRLALIVAARSLSALGAWTNRAYGWVEITPVDADSGEIPLQESDLDKILEWSRS